MSTGALIYFFVFGSVLVLAGLGSLLRPRALVTWSNTGGPAWMQKLRESSGRVTKMWHVLFAGFFFLGSGVLVLLTAIAYEGFDPFHLA